MGTGGKFDVSDRITAERLNRKTLVVDTGDNIVALASTAGQLAFCIVSGSGLSAGILYRRNASNSTWEQIIDDNATQTINNKILASPTLSGTIAGAPTLSGNFATSGTPKIDNATDIKTISTPSDPASGYVRVYGKAVDANNDAIFAKQKIVGAFREARLAPYANVSSVSNINPSSITSGKMLGINCNLTPTTTGRVFIYITFTGNLTDSLQLAQWQIRYGIGTAPTNGATIVGTGLSTVTLRSVNTGYNETPFALTAVLTGLTIGTAYWFDMSVLIFNTGTASASEVNYVVIEM